MKRLKNIIERLYKNMPFVAAKEQRIAMSREIKLLEKILEAHTDPICSRIYNTASCIVFSMDRALQLHALLSTYFEKVKNPVPLHILWRASSEEHREAYEEVFDLFADNQVFSIYQKDREVFRDLLLTMLANIVEDKIFFLVDDIVFFNDLDLSDYLQINTHSAVGSLRLGQNLTRAYTVNQDQELPAFLKEHGYDSNKLVWIWKTGIHDWGYPLSVDGNLFLASEIRTLAESLSFTSPNTFESSLQLYTKYFERRMGVCYQTPKIINIPINRVQIDYKNICGNFHQNDLLQAWSEGYQMNYRKIYGFVNESAHQAIDITLIKR